MATPSRGIGATFFPRGKYASGPKLVRFGEQIAKQ